MLALLAGVAMLPASAAALQMDGLPLRQASGNAGNWQMDTQRVMRFMLDGATVSITPWPAGLPTRLRTQTISSSNVPRAAGPIRRLTLQQAGSAEPWLQLLSNAPVGSEPLPGWQLLLDSTRHLNAVRSDGRTYPLRVGKGRKLKDETGCWQFMLLDLRLPDSGAGAEQEARADWYLRKLPRC
ncbi:hypothetical protein IGB42_02417 [Andreprevotia sp. IGB-42]|uniref:hypothetical protein n=1 Tax=Andreprevotia sp. IGB-42 TaxID=2497473 RepID=UPI00135708A8|nr:hypothetical protein [Andreprevotia sp. IGB-42]KAF0813021.1 hypothetical protein IGB42_02417 [Andreprevotia sp. IGB-42]